VRQSVDIEDRETRGNSAVFGLAEPRVLTCSTEFFTCSVGEISSPTLSDFSHAVSPSTARADANNVFVFIAYNFVGFWDYSRISKLQNHTVLYATGYRFN
jgi:hypothetical protein